MTKTIGVIGLGSIGQRHASNLKAWGHTVIGCDTHSDTSTLPALSEWYKSPDGLFQFYEKLDGLIIASPTDQHLFHWSNADLPCFIEKPIADHPDQVWEELDTRKEHVTMVGNNLRFHPCVITAKEWLTDIGEVIWGSFTIAQYNDKPAYMRDGVTLNWGAHEIDLALHLLGEARVVSAVIDPQDTIADITLYHSSHRSRVHLDYLTRPFRRGFCIIGDHGIITADLERRLVSCDPADGGAKQVADFSDSSIDQDYVEEIGAFIDLIDGKPVPHAATGEDGLRTLEIITEAKKLAGI